jgi:hypothetical protein
MPRKCYFLHPTPGIPPIILFPVRNHPVSPAPDHLNYKPVIERDLAWNGYRDFTGNGIIPLLGLEVDF